jgi:hypothetical protein
MKMKIYKQNFTTIYLTILVLLFSLQGGFISSPLIQYADEIFAVYAVVQIILHLNVVKKNAEQYKLFRITTVTLVIIVIIGVISNIWSGLVGVIPLLIDMVGIIKLPVSFIYVLCIVNSRDKKAVLNNFKWISKIFVVIVFVCGVINYIHDIGMTFDIRYGLRSYKFLYSNPGGLNATLFVAFSIIALTSSTNITRILFETITLADVVMTLRGSGIGVVGVILMLKVYNRVKRMSRSFNVKKLIPVGVGAVILAWNQIVEYFIEQTSLRSLLLRNAIVVFKRYFPLGSGFATYGSDQAFKHYSKLYYEFGYNNIHMLSPENGAVANDNFWPMLVAQFGLTGCIGYLYLIYSQFRYVLKLKLDAEVKITAIGLLSVLLIGSMGNAVYTSASGMLIYILLGLILNR